jgi:hypothetical protein
MKRKYLIIILAVAVIVSGFFLAFRYFKNKKELKNIQTENQTESNSENSNQNGNEGIGNNDSPDANESDSDDEENADDEDSSSSADNVYLEVDKTDCANNCKDFKSDESDFKYCQEFCSPADETGGSQKTDTEKSGDCDDKSGLDKDYCWKDKAIEDENIKTCEKIQDENLKQACKNRVSEDIIDQSGEAE